MGGIFDFADAVEFMLAGASAVQVGTANLVNPMASIEIIEGLRNYCVENNIDNIKEIVGRADYMTDKEIIEIFQKTGGLLKGHFY